MFDIGWSELVIIGVVALIAIGPKELPGVLRSVGFWMGKVRRMAAEFQGQFQEAMREAEMSDLKKHADDLNNTAKQLTSSFDNFDPLKDSSTAKASETVSTTASETPVTEVPATDAKVEPAPPDNMQAEPPSSVPSQVAPAEPAAAPAAGHPEPLRREA